jgi:hypothetical protein
MIIQEQGDQLLLIRQTDHAFLAGFLAKEWGNEKFVKPEPFASFCLAAAEHDNGWSETELQPGVDPKARLPYSFMSIPTEEHILIYQRGIERLVKADHYAALLVCMHAAGLYDKARATMPGFSAKYVKSNETQLANDFVQRLRLQQLRLKVDLRANPEMKEYVDEKNLKVNFERLEALDRLSLYFCTAPRENSLIDAVPTDNAGGDADLELRPEGKNVVTLSPYPFRRETLELSVLARRIPKRVYSDDVDLQQTLAKANYFAVKFTLKSRRGNMIHRAAGF